MSDSPREIPPFANGEPMRPVALREEFLAEHRAEGVRGTAEHGAVYRTAIDQHTCGAATPPARGYSEEEWARMTTDEQRRARQAQFRQDASDQIQWEQKARAEWEGRMQSARGTDE